MAKRKVSFSQVADVVGSGRAALKGRDERVVLHVLVDVDCPRELASALRDSLVAQRRGGVVEVASLPGPLPEGDVPDAALVLVGSSRLDDVVASYARSGVPVALIVEGALDVPHFDLPEQASALVGVVAASSPESLPEKLSQWLVASTNKDIALAANFPFCRNAVVDALVARCAVENAAVGAISLIPGSDLPVMTANQAKLALDIAAAYGRGADLERAGEIAGVIGVGLVYRTAARALVGLVPGVGMLLKAGIGFGGTVATARAIRARLELQDRPAGGGETAPVPEARSVASPTLPVSASAGDDGYVTIAGGSR